MQVLLKTSFVNLQFAFLARNVSIAFLLNISNLQFICTGNLWIDCEDMELLR